ncbi:MAG: chemotaxis protein CheW [Desulfuromonadaceae bacterium]|nr:chemotaxis protein CheW [Desulfuromonadaceae bacterium]
MNVDLSQFYQVFFDESAEHLAEMERIFLAIDPLNPDDEDLNALFRSAHSIKGGAGTFGFPDMTVVTHTLETLLDLVRHHEIPLSREMVDVFLQAGDAISMQLAGHRDGSKVDQQVVEKVCEQLSAISGSSTPSAGKPEQVASPALSAEKIEATSESTYRIVFKPPPDLYSRMVRMEPIFEELASMGDFTVTAGIEPHNEFDKYDPTRCEAIWEMNLTTSHPPADIFEVFMFVADEEEICIEKLSTPILPGRETDSSTETGSAATRETGAANSGEIMGRRSYDKNETAPGAYGRRGNENAEASSIRVGVVKVDQLINQMGELVITQAMLAQSAIQLDPVQHENLHRSLALLERTTRDLQESVMSIRMMPINFIFSRFPRLVHDLADKLGKQIELKLVGESTELDKGLVEKLADPLTHLVRNSIDHGIESPEARIAGGKSPCGAIILKASQQGGRVVIEVADDGAGLNRERILAKAAKNGLPVSDSMSDEEVWQLIFAPGFSTADQVTDVSGRGVGMDVVLRNVNAMGGRVSVYSFQGKGSRVVISLPLTLAILDGLSVRVGNETFIVPINSIIESLQPRIEDLNEVGQGNATVHVRGEYIPLMRLGEIFAIHGAVRRPEEAVVMLVDAEGEHLALLVDELLGQHQVVIKSLETNYRKVDGTAGATILGDGRVALILDAVDMVRLWRSR